MLRGDLYSWYRIIETPLTSYLNLCGKKLWARRRLNSIYLLYERTRVLVSLATFVFCSLGTFSGLKRVVLGNGMEWTTISGHLKWGLAAALRPIKTKPGSTSCCVPRAPQRAVSTNEGARYSWYVKFKRDIPRLWYLLGQLKEQAGLLVSRSLTLPSAPPWAEGVIWWFPLYPKKKLEWCQETKFLSIN